MAIKSKKVRVTARERVRIRIRKRISGSAAKPRMAVFRSSKHIYAQLIDDVSGKTIAMASTLDKEVMARVAKLDVGDSSSKAKSTKSLAAARVVGLLIAERSKGHNVSQVVFDRGGFLFHGRIKAAADGAREGGLQF